MIITSKTGTFPTKYTFPHAKQTLTSAPYRFRLAECQIGICHIQLEHFDSISFGSTTSQISFHFISFHCQPQFRSLNTKQATSPLQLRSDRACPDLRRRRHRTAPTGSACMSNPWRKSRLTYQRELVASTLNEPALPVSTCSLSLAHDPASHNRQDRSLSHRTIANPSLPDPTAWRSMAIQTDLTSATDGPPQGPPTLART